MYFVFCYFWKNISQQDFVHGVVCAHMYVHTVYARVYYQTPCAFTCMHCHADIDLWPGCAVRFDGYQRHKRGEGQVQMCIMMCRVGMGVIIVVCCCIDTPLSASGGGGLASYKPLISVLKGPVAPRISKSRGPWGGSGHD